MLEWRALSSTTPPRLNKRSKCFFCIFRRPNSTATILRCYTDASSQSSKGNTQIITASKEAIDESSSRVVSGYESHAPKERKAFLEDNGLPGALSPAISHRQYGGYPVICNEYKYIHRSKFFLNRSGSESLGARKTLICQISRRKRKVHYQCHGLLGNVDGVVAAINNLKPRVCGLRALAPSAKGLKHEVALFPIKTPRSSVIAGQSFNAISGFPRIRHFSSSSQFQAKIVADQPTQTDPLDGGTTVRGSIRERLLVWEKQRQQEEATNQANHDLSLLLSIPNFPMTGPPASTLMRSYSRGLQGQRFDHDQDDGSDFAHTPGEDGLDTGRSEEDIHRHLEPGDLIDFYSEGTHKLAVVIRRFDRQMQLYTVDGHWLHRRAESIHFMIPNFFAESDLRGLVEYLPAEQIPDSMLEELQILSHDAPRKLGRPLLIKMQDFARETREIYRHHSKDIDNAYSAVAHKKTITYWTLEDIVRKALHIPGNESIPNTTLWAVYTHLVALDFGALPPYRGHTGTWEILPLLDLDRVRQVQWWVREHQDQMMAACPTISPELKYGDMVAEVHRRKSTIFSEFVQTARNIIADSRKHRQVVWKGGVGPGLLQDTTQDNSGTSSCTNKTSLRSVILGTTQAAHATIIRYMELFAISRRLSPRSLFYSLGTTILRATGMYEDYELDASTGCIFLQEMGVIIPWENLAMSNPRLGLPNGSNPDSHRLLSTAKDVAVEDLVDQMSDLRRDWGDMDVFCIDSSSTTEIDDGFSLETIPGVEEQYWVHIHVANPTAFINPKSPISEHASLMLESTYSPEARYPMLPSSATRLYSLDRNRPVLTFSAKLTTSGDMVDYKITPGIIRKVIYMTHQHVEELFPSSSVDEEHDFRYHVGPGTFESNKGSKEKPTRDLASRLSDQQKQSLSKLIQLGSSHWAKFRSNVVQLTPFSSGLTVWVSGHLSGAPCRDKVRRIEGDPSISVQARFWKPYMNVQRNDYDGPQRLVSNFMTLANKIAGRWSLDRGIPTIFRGISRRPGSLEAASWYQENVLEPAINKDGQVPLALGARYLGLSGAIAVAGTKPHLHDQIGTDTYVRATSPLRRYTDMIAHWQIEAALRREAELGHPLVGNTDESSMPFSSRQLESIIPGIEESGRIHRKAQLDSIVHWYLQLLHRAVHFGECPTLPKVFKMYITKDHSILHSYHYGFIRELSMQAFMTPGPLTRNVGVRLGDWFEVKIAHVATFEQKLFVEAVRLLERTTEE